LVEEGNRVFAAPGAVVDHRFDGITGISAFKEFRLGGHVNILPDGLQVEVDTQVISVVHVIVESAVDRGQGDVDRPFSRGAVEGVDQGEAAVDLVADV